MFLASYRFFLPPRDLLEALVGWYNCEADDSRFPGSEAFLKKCKKSIQARAVRIILLWIRDHWIDFHSDPKLAGDLAVFVDYVGALSFGTHQKLSASIREQVQRFCDLIIGSA